MPLDFLYADLESFEYQALIKDYNVSQTNQTLEAKKQKGIYEGQVQAQTARTRAAGTTLSGIGKVAKQSQDLPDKYKLGGK